MHNICSSVSVYTSIVTAPPKEMKCLVILVVTLVTIANGYPHDVKSFAEAEQQRQNKMESLEQMLKDFLDELKQSTKQGMLNPGVHY